MNKLNNKKSDKGFTLIELMIVVAIIGILAAIAIPQFSSYRIRAFNSAAESDMRNIMNGEEAYFADNETYADVAKVGSQTASTTTFGSLPGVKLSKGVYGEVTGSDVTDFTANTKHYSGDKTYTGSASAGIVSSASSAGSSTF